MQAKVRNVLVGIVQNRVEMAAQVRQVVIDRGDDLLQPPLYLPRGIGGGIGGFRFNEVNDGLGLGQGQLAV